MGSWHTLEQRKLLEMVGRVPIADIAHELGRSESSVRSRARELQRQGLFDWPIEPFVSSLVECPECGQMRTRIVQNGRCMCRVCCAEQTLERNIQWRLEAYDALPPSERGKVGIEMPLSRYDTRPTKPSVAGMKPQEAAAAIEAWLIADEEWEVSYLTRVTNAVKQRTFAYRQMANKGGKNGR